MRGPGVGGGVGFTPVSLLQMADIVEVSRTSTLELQNQLDEYKEKNRRELAEMQRQLKEKTLEAEKSRLTAMKLQDEVIMADQRSSGLPVFRIFALHGLGTQRGEEMGFQRARAAAA